MPPERLNMSRNVGLLFFILFSIVIISGAQFYYSHEQNSLKEDKAEALRAVALLKSGQISGWYMDEIHDASIIANNNLLVEQVEKFMESGTEEEKQKLRQLLANTAEEHGYEYIMYIDTSGNMVASEDIDEEGIDPVLTKVIARSFATRSVVSTGLYRCDKHTMIHIDFASQVRDDFGKLVGTLVMQVDPHHQFYPLIQTWPTPSKTSETMLLLKESDSIRFVNELRHKKNTALQLTLPLSDTNYTAVKAAQGISGIVEGKDYRGVEVMSWVDSIPGTPWYMVAESDQSEILEGLKNKGFWIIIFVIILIIMAGLGVGYIFTLQQKNLYKELFLTKEEFRATLYSIGDAVITTDIEGSIIYMNPVAQNLTGWDEKETRGRQLESVFKVIHETSRKPVENPVMTVLKKGIVVGMAKNTLLISKNGREIPIADSGAPIRNEEGKTVGVVLVFRDQTEERMAERELMESEQRYRLLFEDHTAVKLLIDPETGEIVDANKSAEYFYGWSIDVLRKMNINQINILPEEELKKALSDARSRKRVFFEFRHRLSNGVIKDVEVYSSKVNTKDRELVHSIVHDVTARKRAEEQLKLLNKSVDQSPVNIIITNAEGNVEYVNSGFTKMTGYFKEEVLGNNPRFMASGYHDEKFYKNLWDTILSGKDWQGEFVNKRKSGEIYWESAVITPVLNDTGEITHFIGIKEDITENKKMLEQLVEAKEKAEESERLKSAFLANMSHEIRTPLNGILGFTSLLTSGERFSVAKKQQYSDIINKSAESLLQIINDILDISRLDAKQMEIEKKKFDLNQTIKRLYDIFLIKMETAEKNDVELKVVIPENTIMLENDEKRLSQIFSNLLDNALKFTVHGSIEFGILSIKDQAVELMVKDTGIGIPPEKHKVIFERFRQADDSIAINYGGSGLGLSIVKQLVDLMGGRISVESELGKGTDFRLWFPLHD